MTDCRPVADLSARELCLWTRCTEASWYIASSAQVADQYHQHVTVLNQLVL